MSRAELVRFSGQGNSIYDTLSLLLTIKKKLLKKLFYLFPFEKFGILNKQEVFQFICQAPYLQDLSKQSFTRERLIYKDDDNDDDFGFVWFYGRATIVGY